MPFFPTAPRFTGALEGKLVPGNRQRKATYTLLQNVLGGTTAVSGTTLSQLRTRLLNARGGKHAAFPPAHTAQAELLLRFAAMIDAAKELTQDQDKESKPEQSAPTLAAALQRLDAEFSELVLHPELQELRLKPDLLRLLTHAQEVLHARQTEPGHHLQTDTYSATPTAEIEPEGMGLVTELDTTSAACSLSPERLSTATIVQTATTADLTALAGSEKSSASLNEAEPDSIMLPGKMLLPWHTPVSTPLAEQATRFSQLNYPPILRSMLADGTLDDVLKRRRQAALTVLAYLDDFSLAVPPEHRLRSLARRGPVSIRTLEAVRERITHRVQTASNSESADAIMQQADKAVTVLRNNLKARNMQRQDTASSPSSTAPETPDPDETPPAEKLDLPSLLTEAGNISYPALPESPLVSFEKDQVLVRREELALQVLALFDQASTVPQSHKAAALLERLQTRKEPPTPDERKRLSRRLYKVFHPDIQDTPDHRHAFQYIKEALGHLQAAEKARQRPFDTSYWTPG